MNGAVCRKIENHRERVLTAEEEALYFAGAKSEAMNQHMDPSLLSDVATILLDCGLRPEECFRFRKKQHAKAIDQATALLRKQTGREDVSFQGFELYTLRHTCLTRWAPQMDPWTLAYLAGHRDMNITKRYVHPQEQTILDAMEKVREVKGRHNSNFPSETGKMESAAIN